MKTTTQTILEWTSFRDTKEYLESNLNTLLIIENYLIQKGYFKIRFGHNSFVGYGFYYQITKNEPESYKHFSSLKYNSL